MSDFIPRMIKKKKNPFCLKEKRLEKKLKENYSKVF